MWDTLSSFAYLALDGSAHGAVASNAAQALPARGIRLAAAPVELSGLSPAVVGVVLGALVGVLAFIGVAFVVTARGRRREAALARTPAFADELVVIPPYVTLPAAPAVGVPARAPSFAPTSELSARAFSRMGYDVAAGAHSLTPAPEQAWVAAAASSEDVLPSDLLVEDDSGPSARAVPPAPETAPILGAPVVMVGPARHTAMLPPASGPVALPHPLSVLAKLPALTVARAEPRMGGASVADLELDDNLTEIAETVFDEPPQPMLRGSRPKIRRVAPAAPRTAPPPPALPRRASPRPAAGRPPSRPDIPIESRPAPSQSGIVFSGEEPGPTEVYLVRKVDRGA